MLSLRALDLFCGAGGASMGLHRAGYEVTGIDIERQPNYPFSFQQGDCTRIEIEFLRQFDLIWASPPCQAFTAYRRRPKHVAPRENLIPQMRKLLMVSGISYIIENVPGAPLKHPVQLCGSAFGLNVRRHRIFECTFKVIAPGCMHGWQTPRFPPATNRENLRSTVEVGVWRIPIVVQQTAMGIDWMLLKELSQAVPPAYSEFLARELITQQYNK